MGGGVGGAGVRVDVNAMLGVGGDVGYGGCEPRIEGIVQCTIPEYHRCKISGSKILKKGNNSKNII